MNPKPRSRSHMRGPAPYSRGPPGAKSPFITTPGGLPPGVRPSRPSRPTMFDAINAAKGVMPRPPPGCGGALTNGEAEAPCLGGACIPPPPPAPVASYGYGGRLWSPT